MKRKFLFLAILVMAAIAAGCSRQINANGKTETFQYAISGKSQAAKVYWRTEAESVHTVTPKDGGYSIPSLNRHLTDYTVTVADNPQFSNAAVLTVPRIGALIAKQDFQLAYDRITSASFDYGTFFSLNAPLAEGNNEVTSHGVTRNIAVNDGQIIGISFTELVHDADSASNALLGNTIVAIALALDSSADDVVAMIQDSAKAANKDKALTITSNGIHYRIARVQGILIALDMYK